MSRAKGHAGHTYEDQMLSEDADLDFMNERDNGEALSEENRRLRFLLGAAVDAWARYTPGSELERLIRAEIGGN